VIRVLIVYDVDGWAYHSRALALQQYSPEGFEIRIAGMETKVSGNVGVDGNVNEGQSPSANSLLQKDPTLREEPTWVRSRLIEIFGEDRPDVILSLCSFLAKPIRRLLSELGWNSKLIASSNSGWPHRIEHFERLFDYADWVVVNNRDYLEKSGSPARCSAISNGVDSRSFYLERPISVRQPKVIWSGSQRHRNIKGYDACVVPVFEQLRREGIDCEALLVDSRGEERLDREQMRKWYNDATIYLCASETEGTPNPALEAAACGCTVVSTRVGNMPELLRDRENGVFVQRQVDDILEGIRFAVANHVTLASQLYKDIQDWSWSRRSEQYYQLFENVARLDGKGAPIGKVSTNAVIPCIEKEVTVFVSTIDNISFSECMKHLALQDCRFRIEVIENVAPMSAAFQQMIDRCRTPYYVQVDEDMLLKPHAIRTLYECVQESDDDHAIVVRLLWDDHLRRAIQGVKIYRHGIVSQFPYRDVQSCEIDQIKRFQAHEFKIARPIDREYYEDSPEVLGYHGKFFHIESVYERYFSLMQKRKKYAVKVHWIDRHLIEFFERFKADPTEFNLMAVLGFLAGHLVGHHRQEDAGEKDFRKYKSLPGLQFAREFYAQCSELPIPAPELPIQVPMELMPCFPEERSSGVEDRHR
jgi:hypothetical protein